MKRDRSSHNKHSLPPEIAAATDAAFSGLEKKFPGISGDLEVRGQVEAAISAALDSLKHVVPEATEIATRQAMEKALRSKEDPSQAATRKVVEKLGRTAVESE
jgi:hypothetical protein